jgi:hypothetical protein
VLRNVTRCRIDALQVLYWLSGLTCNDENFIMKSGAQRAAAAHGIALVVPDTSPRMSKLNPLLPLADSVMFLGFMPAHICVRCPVQKRGAVVEQDAYELRFPSLFF